MEGAAPIKEQLVYIIFFFMKRIQSFDMTSPDPDFLSN